MGDLPNKNKQSGYMKYSTLAIQLVAVIVGLTFLGRFIDQKLENTNFPLFTVILALFSVFAALYYLIKSIK